MERKERSTAIPLHIPVRLAKHSQPRSATNCYECNQVIISDDADYTPLRCFVCENHFHDGCLSFDAESAECLRSIVEIVGWVCEPCRLHARDQMKAPSSQSTQQPSQPSTSSAKTKNTAIKKLEADVVDIRGTCSSIANDVQQMSALLNNILAFQPGIHGIQAHSASTSVQAAPVQSGSEGVDLGRPSYSSMASRSLPPLHPLRPTVSKPLDTEMVMRSVCSEMKDKERRRRNVIVSGLEPDERFNDVTLFDNICDTFLDIDISGEINASLTRRLPSNKAVKPLLVVFKREETAAEILRVARSLRDATSPRVASVFINADLTPTEAKLAFEERERRRARNIARSLPIPPPSVSAMDVVQVTGPAADAGSSAAAGAGTGADGGASADGGTH